MSNFSVLGQHDEQLLRLGMLAEKYFADDPNTCLIKLRQLTEVLAQLLAARAGLFLTAEESQYELLRRLRDSGVLPNEIYQIFGEVRRTGNNAAHALSGDRRTALAMLKLSWQLGLWFHRTFKDPHFKSGPFIPPRAPADKSEELQADLAKLAAELEAYRAANTQAAEKLSTGSRTQRIKGRAVLLGIRCCRGRRAEGQTGRSSCRVAVGGKRRPSKHSSPSRKPQPAPCHRCIWMKQKRAQTH